MTTATDVALDPVPRAAIAPPDPATSATRRDPATVLGVGAVIALGVLATPIVRAPFFSPRVAGLFLLIGPGLLFWWARVRQGERAARAAGVFLFVAGLAALLAPTPALALFGRYNQGTGWLFFVALVAVWSVGTRLRNGGGRRSLQHALLAVIVANAIVGVLQVAAPTLGRGNVLLQAVDGRAIGLVGNAALFGPFAAVGVYLLAITSARTIRWRRAVFPAAIVVGAAVQASGSRAALIIAVAGVLLAARVRPRHVIAVAALAAVGFGLVAVTHPGADGAAARASDGSAGLDVRLDVWRAGLGAVGDRPWFGWGPDGFLAATSNRMTPRVAASNNEFGEFTDAHNVIVEVAVDTGVLGLFAAGAWIAFASRRSSGPLAVAALLLAAAMLLEPISMVLAPLALLCLGAAGPDESPPPLPSRWRAALAPLVASTAVLALTLLAGDAQLKAATLDLDPGAAHAAATLMPYWPEPASAEMRAASFAALQHNEPAASTAALNDATRATQLDPANPTWWLALGDLQYRRHDRPAAHAAYARALARDPQNANAKAGIRRTG